MEYLAHIADDGREQTAQAHCRKAAEYAAAALRQVRLACLAALAGLLHDMGKFKEAYRLYLRLAAAGDPAARSTIRLRPCAFSCSATTSRAATQSET